MKSKHVILLIFSALTMLLLIGCQSVFQTLKQEQLTMEAKNRLETMSQQLRVPSGTVSVKRIEVSTGGQEPGCDGHEILELMGTNELPFIEVLDFYSSSLESSSWHLLLATEHGRTFIMGDEFALGVSDHYVVSGIGITPILEAQSKFRTLFLLELSTSDQVPPPVNCSGG